MFQIYIECLNAISGSWVWLICIDKNSLHWYNKDMSLCMYSRHVSNLKKYKAWFANSAAWGSVYSGNKSIMFTKIWMPQSWWRHQIEIFSKLLALCEGNSPVTGEFPSQRPVTLWCFLWFSPEQTVERTIEKPVISDAITLIMMSL